MELPRAQTLREVSRQRRRPYMGNRASYRLILRVMVLLWWMSATLDLGSRQRIGPTCVECDPQLVGVPPPETRGF